MYRYKQINLFNKHVWKHLFFTWSIFTWVDTWDDDEVKMVLTNGAYVITTIIRVKE